MGFESKRRQRDISGAVLVEGFERKCFFFSGEAMFKAMYVHVYPPKRAIVGKTKPKSSKICGLLWWVIFLCQSLL